MPETGAIENKISEKQEPGVVDISVIIASFNSSQVICMALEAIYAQQTQYTFEVIVVDSSKDDTQKIVGREFPQVNLIALPRQTYPGSARNIGVKNARGKYVVFTDSDCLPKPDWIERILNKFQQVDTDAIGGSLLNGYPKSLIAWMSHLIEFNEWTETSKAGYVNNNPSANLAYKKDTFEKLNEYFPDYFGSEDTILNTRMRKKGAKIYFDPAIQIVHLNRMAFIKLIVHQYRLGLWSAEARRTKLVSGEFLTRFKFLALVLPFIRWARAFLRLIGKDVPQFLIFLVGMPFYLAATFSWSIGFVSRKPLKYSKEPITEIMDLMN